MALQVDGQPTRYMRQRFFTAKVMVHGQWFDLGLADTARCVEPANAKATLRNLYDRAGGEPRSVEDYLEEVAELVAACKQFTGWKPPKKIDRAFGKRRMPQSTSWRTI